ncbi:MAG: hypothetical protein PHH59_13005 [Methylovulum sp.]|uniref:hypothetical protein n=1 Tax=Methylovulum sp. TaxID=1916980 RepID=UPI002601E1E4|nr:hypothetical protein [Methylovulum sp.]MDD2724927.1 hypothetical protein [Methylovulum sp.]
MSNKFFNILAGFLLLLASGSLFATQVDRVTLDEAISEAGLIFQGTVTKIESRIASDMGSNYEKEFYAFVTFRVDRLIKGQIEGGGATFTLPFISCVVFDYKKQMARLEQQPTMNPTEAVIEQQPAMTEQLGEGMVCMVSGMPRFMIGDSDILFVHGNYAYAMNPLVGWWQGRFSIVNNKIYPVTWLTKEGGIDFTAPYGLEDEQEAEKLGQVLPQKARKHGWTQPQDARRMGPDEFVEVIEKKLRGLEKNQFMAGAQTQKPVKSADFKDSFYYRGAKAMFEQNQKREAGLLEMPTFGVQQGE